MHKDEESIFCRDKRDPPQQYWGYCKAVKCSHGGKAALRLGVLETD
jgi:hypothetical protein